MKRERVELHIHTKMSAMDGTASVGVYIKRAAAWGHPAIAVTDHGCVQAFPEAMRAAEECRKQGHSVKILYGMEAYCADKDGTPPFHLTILVQNRTGLKNLYQLVSLSHRHPFRGVPVITKEELQKHRTGLLVGSGCGNGKLFCAAARGEGSEELRTIAREYDFLEIQPIRNGPYAPANPNDLQRLNGMIVQIGEETRIPVCATGNVHYSEPKDAQARCILKSVLGLSEDRNRPSLHFRSTKEMLDAFAYLGEEKAYEVVIENTNRIAETIEELRPIPMGRFFPHAVDAEERLDALVGSRAKALYGTRLPDIVKERIEKERLAAKKQKAASLFLIARQQIEHSEQAGYPVTTRGAVSASLLSYLTGISEINPLPPHYRCPQCRNTEFFTRGEVESGFDLPRKTCPVCGTDMQRDGHDIPWQDFFGQSGECIPDFDLNFSGEYIVRGYAKSYLEALFGKTHVVEAWTVATVSERLALLYIREYEKNTGAAFSDETRERLVGDLTGVKRAFDRDPGGFVIIPENFEAEDFTPLQYTGADADSAVCTHFDFRDLGETLLKLDDLGCDVSTLYHYLEQYTGIPAANADLFDGAVYEHLFSPTRAETAVKFPRVSYAVALVMNRLPTACFKSCLPRNFSGLRKALGFLRHGSFSENAPGYCKAYATEHALAAVRLGWYNVYYPREFAKAYQRTFEDRENRAVMV